MKRSGAVFMIGLGLLSLAVAAGFAVTVDPLTPSGRGGAPAVVLELIGAGAGVCLLVLGTRALIRKR